MNHINDMTNYLSEIETDYENLDYYFPKHDARVWALLVDPKKTKLLVFCKVNHQDINTVSFDIICSAGTFYGIGSDFVAEKIHQLINR